MNGREKIEISDDLIKIIGKSSYNIVMYKNERIVTKEKKLAEIATKNGGHILEIGFGLHLCADGVQNNPNVLSHTIIEVHSEIYNKALNWSKDKKNVNLILGDWIDILPIKDIYFDGIIHDTFLDENIPEFLNKIKNNCKKNTIVVFAKHPFDGRMNVMKTNDYEIKYTVFNGNNFYKEKINPQLI